MNCECDDNDSFNGNGKDAMMSLALSLDANVLCGSCWAAVTGWIALFVAASTSLSSASSLPVRCLKWKNYICQLSILWYYAVCQIYMYNIYLYIHIKWTRTARYVLPLPIWYIIFVFILFTLWMLFVGYVKCDNFMLRLEIDMRNVLVSYIVYTYIWKINMNMIDVVES